MSAANRLSLIHKLDESDKFGYKLGLFSCLCGSEVVAPIARVKKGNKKSCGCLHIELKASFGESNKKSYGEAAFNECYGSYRRSARIRKYEFSLTPDEFRDIVTGPCIYCGDSLTQSKRAKGNNGTFEYTGIDRYVNSEGYTVNNSVSCCMKCNRIKTNMPVETLACHLEKMVARIDLWKRVA